MGGSAPSFSRPNISSVSRLQNGGENLLGSGGQLALELSKTMAKQGLDPNFEASLRESGFGEIAGSKKLALDQLNTMSGLTTGANLKSKMGIQQSGLDALGNLEDTILTKKVLGQQQGINNLLNVGGLGLNSYNSLITGENMNNQNLINIANMENQHNLQKHQLDVENDPFSNIAGTLLDVGGLVGGTLLGMPMTPNLSSLFGIGKNKGKTPSFFGGGASGGGTGYKKGNWSPKRQGYMGGF